MMTCIEVQSSLICIQKHDIINSYSETYKNIPIDSLMFG